MVGLTFLSTVILISAPTKAVESEDRWLKADQEIMRLSPAVFRELPRRLVRKLLTLKCAIPQAKEIPERHNVISGNFSRANRIDWAVLCSRKGSSSILVFWGGSANSFSEIAKAHDRAFLQTIDGGGTIGFSRKISPVNGAYIVKHYHDYGGPKPPPINYQGIDGGFLGKASAIHYYFRDKWVQLQGAD